MLPEIVLLAAIAVVQPKPDAPNLKPVAVHAMYDRTAKVELAAEVSLMTFDTVQTCHFLAHGGHEDNLPTQRCAGMIGLQLSFAAGAEGLTWVLHKTGHHKLERIPRIYLMYGNASGIAYSKLHRGW